MHRINDARIGSKREERLLSPWYTVVSRSSFILLNFFTLSSCAVNASLYADTTYATNCIVIAWLSVSDSSVMFLAVCVVICGIGVFILRYNEFFRVREFLEKLKIFRLLISLRR